MILCPNKSSSEWRALEARLGSELLAYNAYVQNNYEIPEPDQAYDALLSSPLERKLTGFLSQVGVSVEVYEDLRSITGYDAVGASDLLYKTVLLKAGASEQELAKETAYMAYSLLGRKNKIRTDLISSVSQLPSYEGIAASYRARNASLSEYKVKELVAVDLIADAIRNNWEVPADNPDGREASYWSIKGNSKLEKKLRYHLGRIRMWWNNWLGKTPLDAAGVDGLINDIATDIVQHNFRKFGTELAPDQQQVYYDTTITQDAKAEEIVRFMQGQGLLLTGSLALRKEGTIFRGAGETLHDLDFTMTDDLVQAQLSEIENGITVPVMGGMGQITVPASDMANYMGANMEALLGQVDIVQQLRAQYPEFQIKNIFKGINEGEYSMAGQIGDHMIDIFFVKDTGIDQNEKGFQDWQEIFKAKIKMGRAKDMRDFANYIPYHQKPDMLAQQVGMRHFNFAPIVMPREMRAMPPAPRPIPPGVSEIDKQLASIDSLLKKIGEPSITPEMIDLSKYTVEGDEMQTTISKGDMVVGSYKGPASPERTVEELVKREQRLVDRNVTGKFIERDRLQEERVELEQEREALMSSQISFFEPEETAQNPESVWNDFGAWLETQPHPEVHDLYEEQAPASPGDRIFVPEDYDIRNTALQQYGEPLRLYHGSPNSFGAFTAPGQPGYRKTTRDTGGGIYFTMNRDEAVGYGPFVKEVHVVMQKPYWWYGKDRLPALTDPFNILPEQIESLLDLGYDGIVLKEEGNLEASGENDYVIAFSPEQVFDAPIDPEQAENDRLAYNPSQQVSFLDVSTTMAAIQPDRDKAREIAEREMANLIFGIKGAEFLAGNHPDPMMAWDEPTNPPMTDAGGTQILTNKEYFDYMVATYLDNVRELDVLQEELQKDPLYLKKKSIKSLRELYDKMGNTYGKLERNTHGLLYIQVGNALGEALTARQLSKLGLDPDLDENKQDDISWFQKWTQSIVDFDIEQAGIQDISKRISVAAMMFKRENFLLQQDLSALMVAVHDLHYAAKPKSWKEKYVPFAGPNSNEPFEFMLQKGIGGYVGNFTKTNVLRQALANAKAASGVDSVEYKLAEAQLNLMQFVHKKMNGLLEENNHKLKRKYNGQAFMPHMAMDVYEEYKQTGLFGAWMHLVGKEYRNAIGNVLVTYDGKTFTVDEWRNKFKGNVNKERLAFLDTLPDSQQIMEGGKIMTVAEAKLIHKALIPAAPKGVKQKVGHLLSNAGVPFTFNKIISMAEKKVRNGDGGVSGFAASSELANFSNTVAVPLRYIQRRKPGDFSVNVHKLLTNSFKQLLFKKHHDPLVVDLQALHDFYNFKGMKGGTAMKENMEFLEMYTNRYMFGDKDEISKTWFGGLGDRLNALTTMAYLGASPATSMYNLFTGIIFAHQDKIARDGLGDGTDKMLIGMSRMLGIEPGELTLKRLRNLTKDGLFNLKAQKIMELYQVDTFNRPDIERHMDKLQSAQDRLMWLQSTTESFIRGSAFLGEMTDEQWDAFQMQDQKLVAVDATGAEVEIANSAAPKAEAVVQWLENINAVQGDYSIEHRRNYHTKWAFRLASLFKGWLPDYIQHRYRPKWTDRNGVVREGYYITALKGIKDYRRYIEHIQSRGQQSTLKPYEVENMRRIIYEIGMWTLLTAGTALGGGDEREKEKRWTAKLSAQLFLSLHPRATLKMVSMPMPMLSLVDKALAGVEMMMEGEVGKGTKQLYQITPGNRGVTMLYENTVGLDEDRE